MKETIKKNWKKAVLYIIGATLTAIGILFGLSSCNVSRVVENKSEFYQKGDTVIQINTKTTETYNASKEK